jgi:hypothetical protein
MRQKTQAVNDMSNSRKNASTSLADWQLDCVHFHIGLSGPQPVPPKEKIMIPVESRLQDEMRSCAVELRQLAYTLQNGVGEHDLLRLSERMRAAADQVVRSGA